MPLPPIKYPFWPQFCYYYPSHCFSYNLLSHRGDKTLASVLSALVTFILPLGILYGMWREFLEIKNDKKFRYDLLALFSVMQLLLVLYYYGLIPLMLWVSY